MFQLTENEAANLKSQIVTPNNAPSSLRSQIVTLKRGGRRTLPYAFTEQGVAMLSSVAAFPTRRGGEHRHHAHLRPAPAADGLQRPARRENRSPRRKIRRPRPAIPTRLRGHQTTHRLPVPTGEGTRLPHHPVRHFREKEETLTSQFYSTHHAQCLLFWTGPRDYL